MRSVIGTLSGTVSPKHTPPPPERCSAVGSAGRELPFVVFCGRSKRHDFSPWRLPRLAAPGLGRAGDRQGAYVATCCARLRRACNRHGAVTWTIPAVCIGKDLADGGR